MLSDEEEQEEEKKSEEKNMNTTEDDSKMKNIKNEIKNTDVFLVASGNFRRRFLPMLFREKKLEMLLRLLKTYGMKEVKAVANAYPCDGDMAKKPNSILFQLGREIAIGEKNRIVLRLGLVHIPVALDESNGGEIFGCVPH